MFFCDQVLRRGQGPATIEPLLFSTKHENWAGPVAMLVGMGLSIWLFSNQTKYVGVVPTHVPSVGDLTFEAGFLITAVVYLVWRLIERQAPAAAVTDLTPATGTARRSLSAQRTGPCAR